MCGRFEEKVGEKCVISILMVFIFLFIGGGIYAQEWLPEGIIRLIENNAENGGVDPTVLFDYFETLHKHPIAINNVTRSELEEMIIFSPFQIESLLEYQKEFGKIVSLSELSLIDGFSESFVADISPFITLSTVNGKLGAAGSKRVKNQLILRAKYPFSLYSKYKFEYSDKIALGFTLENDVGEKFPDFISINFNLRNLNITKKLSLKSFVIGDYSVRMGQGLVLWNTFSMSGSSSPNSTFRREANITPYTSTDEQKFFRGTGVTFGIKNLNFSILFSDKCRDAKVIGSGYYSLPEGGIHNTEQSINNKNRLREYLLGANVSYRFKMLKVGVTTAQYKYDKKNKLPVKEYNRYQMYDGLWGNTSLDLYFSYKKIRLFGETALDNGLSFAAILGVIYAPVSNFETSLLYRYYSKSYIATHSGAYSSTSYNCNENGVMFNFNFTPISNIAISGFFDFVYHPWKRFGIDTDSYNLKSYVFSEWSVNKQHKLSVKVNYSFGSYQKNGKIGARVEYKWNTTWGLGAATRMEYSRSKSNGYMFYQELFYLSPSKKIDCYLRGSLFHIDDWENRIYSYQMDLPNSFSVPAAYGRGINTYITIRYRPIDWVGLYLKLYCTNYFNKVGSDVYGAKLQINLIF